MRPLQYETHEQMQDAIDTYFDQEPQPTVTGLAYHLDLSRQGLINYQVRPEFVDTVKRAKLKIEAIIERRLMYENGGAAGPIFNLKNNFGWVDERKVDAQVTTHEAALDELRRTLDT